MKTLEETKQLAAQYKEVLEHCEDSVYVVKGDNMTLNRTGYSKYELTKVDWPATFKKELAKDKLKLYKPKYSLINLEMVLYKDWLRSELKKLEKLIKSTDAPVVETYMTDFLHIDHPELANAKLPTAEEEEEEEEGPVGLKGPQYFILNKLTNPKCPVDCDNCLVCKYLQDATLQGDVLGIICKK